MGKDGDSVKTDRIEAAAGDNKRPVQSALTAVTLLSKTSLHSRLALRRIDLVLSVGLSAVHSRRVEFARQAYELGSNWIKHRGHVMGEAAQHYRIFETANGLCGIGWNDVGVIRFHLPTTTAAVAERALLRRLPGAQPGAPTPEVNETIAAAKRYFMGERIDFSNIRLDLADQDPFFQRIYHAVRQVGWGNTTTYGTVAKELGTGLETARDIGQAMARNPVPLIIPCHRVLAAGGKVGGFSAPGGSTAKRRMLELEGVNVEPPRPVQQSLAL
jgi:methylated-DNA-[protein]-cysteine S-methyltransferase